MLRFLNLFALFATATLSILTYAQTRSAPRPHQESVYDVVIVGAGWAGLATAAELQKMGVRNFVILDENEKVGGVAGSDPSRLGDFQIEHGPHYYLSHYEQTFELFRWAGIEPEEVLVPVSTNAGTYMGGRGGEVVTYDASNPKSIYDAQTSRGLKLLYGSDALDVRMTMNRVGFEAKDLTPDRMEDWERFDNDTLEAWGERSYGNHAKKFFLEAFFDAIFFQPLEEISKMAGYWVIANTVRGDKWYSPREGVSKILQSVQSKLGRNLELRKTVVHVAKNADGIFEVLVRDNQSGAERKVRAEKVVMAVPPPVAGKMIQSSIPLSRLQRDLINSPYASSIVVNIQLERQYTQNLKSLNHLGKSLAVVYFPFSNAANGRPVAGMAVETGKIGKPLSQKQVLGVHMTHASALHHWKDSDAKIISAVLSQLNDELGLPDSQIEAWNPVITVHRIPYATSTLRLGQAGFLANFWEEQESAQLHPNQLYFAAGASFPTIEGAVDSGTRVGDLIGEEITKTSRPETSLMRREKSQCVAELRGYFRRQR